jgi:TPR repeat protein
MFGFLKSHDDTAAELVLLESQVFDAGDAFRAGQIACGNGNYAEALAIFSLLAEGGDRFAQFEIGCMHAEGQGVEQNYGEAAIWLRRAADQKHAFAQYALGSLYLEGLGVEKNYPVAHMLFVMSVANGHEAAAELRDMAAKHLTRTQVDDAHKLVAA